MIAVLLLVGVVIVVVLSTGERETKAPDGGGVDAAAPPPPAPTPPSAPPLPERDREILTAFVKKSACEPTVCDAVACEKLSDGQSKGLPAHIVRCRWTDVRDPGQTARCAYAHYAYDAERKGFVEMYLSAPVASIACQVDPAFNDRIRGTVGYSGELPR